VTQRKSRITKGHILSNSYSDLKDRKILQIIPRLDTGGAEKTTIDIANSIVTVGANSFVASEGGRFVSELVANRTQFISFPAATKNPFRIFLNGFKLASLIRKYQIDLIHARSRAPAWSALIAAKITKIPFITTYHGSYAGKSTFKIFYNSVMARGEVVIANSHYTASFIRKMHPLATGRIRVVHRGTNMQEFSPTGVPQERVDHLQTQWGTKGKRVILLAARLTDIKGQPILIDAMKILIDRGIQDVIAILAGDSQGRVSYVAELDKQIAELGLQNFVKRVGHCSDMPAALALADLVTMPSTKAETFGRSAVEAQALEKPVIVSGLGAVAETVLSPPDCAAEERTGWRVPPHDTKALAEAMIEALSLTPTAREELGRRARAHVVENFSLDRMTGDTLAIYREILAKNAKKPH
jgi:glycosyltransferase involved in cell wall biosynthesis